MRRRKLWAGRRECFERTRAGSFGPDNGNSGTPTEGGSPCIHVARRRMCLHRLWRSPITLPTSATAWCSTRARTISRPAIPCRLLNRASPPDAMATICRPARSAMTSGKPTRGVGSSVRAGPALFVEPHDGMDPAAEALSQSNWTSHPPRPRSPMPNDRASILSCRVLQRRRWMLPDDAWMLGFASDHVAAPKCVCERHSPSGRYGSIFYSEWASGLALAAEFLGSEDSEMGPLRYQADRRRARRPEAAVFMHQTPQRAAPKDRFRDEDAGWGFRPGPLPAATRGWVPRLALEDTTRNGCRKRRFRARRRDEIKRACDEHHGSKR